MSDCLDENSALELLDGSLATAARVRLERHLESCDACRELVAELAKVDAEETGGTADTERAPLAGGTRGLTHAGPYRIEREVGSGAAGTVYRAIDERSGAIVALKYVTDAAWRARFGREVATLARLVHPGIVRYLDHGETPHGLYLAMEWLEGEDLEQRLRRGPLPWQAARLLGLRLTSALAHAHALGAVHRDLGPRNVFLPAGRVEDAKLLDFGLVRIADGLERTASQAVLGTPFYMAPEQVKDPKRVDARADLFALGVVLFEVVSGVRPFQGDDLFTVWVRIVDAPAPNLRMLARHVPEPFVLLVEALLAKDPAARPGSAADVHHRLMLLDGLARATAVMAPIVPPTHVPRPPSPGSHSSGGLVFVDSRHGATTAPLASSRSGRGALVAAGVGVTALVAASLVVVPRVARRAGTSSASGEAEPPDSSSAVATVASVSAPTDQAATSEKTDEPDERVRTPATKTDKPDVRPSTTKTDGGAPASERLFCGGENVEHRRGGHYLPDPALPDLEPVTIGGACKAVLEDCVIGGAHSVQVLGQSELTLRRCRVLGSVKLVGAVTLTLEGTTLPNAPVITGKGRVIRR
jgi:serine/threonine protein kinase